MTAPASDRQRTESYIVEPGRYAEQRIAEHFGENVLYSPIYFRG